MSALAASRRENVVLDGCKQQYNVTNFDPLTFFDPPTTFRYTSYQLDTSVTDI